MKEEYKLYQAMADLTERPQECPTFLSFPAVGRNEEEALGYAKQVFKLRNKRGYYPAEYFRIRVQEEHNTLYGYEIMINKTRGENDQ